MTTHSARTPCHGLRVQLRRGELWKSYLELQAEVAALTEDNRQLRAALRIFSEVARHSPETLPLGRKSVI